MILQRGINIKEIRNSNLTPRNTNYGLMLLSLNAGLLAVHMLTLILGKKQRKTTSNYLFFFHHRMVSEVRLNLC